MPTARGEFLTTCYDNGTIGRMSADGKSCPPYTHDKDGNKFVGPNDFAPDEPRRDLLHRLGQRHEARSTARSFTSLPDGTISLRAGDMHNANGLAVSKDGKTLYVVETEREPAADKFKIGAGRLAVRSADIRESG